MLGLGLAEDIFSSALIISHDVYVCCLVAWLDAEILQRNLWVPSKELGSASDHSMQKYVQLCGIIVVPSGAST